jgi:hypothetical protein
MRVYIESHTKKGYDKGEYDNRIVQYARDGINDLILLSEKLPEEMQAKIFNTETLSPLIKNLFLVAKRTVEIDKSKKLTTDIPVLVEDIPEIDKDEITKRSMRILDLCLTTLDEIGNMLNARNLAPREMEDFMLAGPSETLQQITGLKAVYLAAFRRRQQEPKLLKG